MISATSATISTPCGSTCSMARPLIRALKAGSMLMARARQCASILAPPRHLVLMAGRQRQIESSVDRGRAQATLREKHERALPASRWTDSTTTAWLRNLWSSKHLGAGVWPSCRPPSTGNPGDEAITAAAAIETHSRPAEERACRAPSIKAGRSHHPMAIAIDKEAGARDDAVRTCLAAGAGLVRAGRAGAATRIQEPLGAGAGSSADSCSSQRACDSCCDVNRPHHASQKECDESAEPRPAACLQPFEAHKRSATACVTVAPPPVTREHADALLCRPRCAPARQPDLARQASGFRAHPAGAQRQPLDVTLASAA